MPECNPSYSQNSLFAVSEVGQVHRHLRDYNTFTLIPRREDCAPMCSSDLQNRVGLHVTEEAWNQRRTRTTLCFLIPSRDHRLTGLITQRKGDGNAVWSLSQSTPCLSVKKLLQEDFHKQDHGSKSYKPEQGWPRSEVVT